MKTLVILDNNLSALSLAANQRFDKFQNEFLYANDYISPKDLIRQIKKKTFDCLLFSWKQAFRDILFHHSLLRDLQDVLADRPIGVLVADYLGLEEVFTSWESVIVKNVDFCLFTNRELHELYRKTFEDLPPSRVFHDLPNLEQIHGLRQSISKRQVSIPIRVLWIGNSNWGKRQGVYDYKRYYSIIKPLQLEMQSLSCCKLEIIDSSKTFIANDEVLIKIRHADVVIQVSQAEGTGIPVLEALGLDTYVISTYVGVVKELFNENDIEVVPPDVSKIHQRIHNLVVSESVSNYINLFHNYVDIATSENLDNINKLRYDMIGITKSYHNWILIQGGWRYRFLKKKLNYYFSKF